MKAEFIPSRPVGSIGAPPSKSMAHRLLIGAGLASGTSVIRGVSESEDMQATLACLEALGATYQREGDVITVMGRDPRTPYAADVLRCRESGSTLRFFIPICLLGAGERRFTGSKTLFSRPLSVYESICAEDGLFFSPAEEGLTVNGRLVAREYRVPGNISSQFISGLLFALPLLEGDSSITILPPFESKAYVSMTLAALADFGIEVERADECRFYIRGGQAYRPHDATVEGDYSGAAFFEALNFLDGEVSVCGLAEDSLQGDAAYRKLYPMIDRGMPTIHIGDCPDLGPVLMALAAAKNGAVFCGTRRLRIKESDRGAAMAEELAKFGASVSVHEDSIVVYPADFHPPREVLCGHNDHRIVMALSTLLVRTGGTIDGAEAVKKSMPDYFERIKKLNVEVILHETA